MIVEEQEPQGLSKRSLRAMRRRWERDLERLEAAYPVDDWSADHPSLETIRNLSTAIIQIEFLTSATRPRSIP